MISYIRSGTRISIPSFDCKKFFHLKAAVILLYTTILHCGNNSQQSWSCRTVLFHLLPIFWVALGSKKSIATLYFFIRDTIEIHVFTVNRIQRKQYCYFAPFNIVNGNIYFVHRYVNPIKHFTLESESVFFCLYGFYFYSCKVCRYISDDQYSIMSSDTLSDQQFRLRHSPLFTGELRGISREQLLTWHVNTFLSSNTYVGKVINWAKLWCNYGKAV